MSPQVGHEVARSCEQASAEESSVIPAAETSRTREMRRNTFKSRVIQYVKSYRSERN